jgi:hypothetical protein
LEVLFGLPSIYDEDSAGGGLSRTMFAPRIKVYLRESFTSADLVRPLRCDVTVYVRLKVVIPTATFTRVDLNLFLGVEI